MGKGALIGVIVLSFVALLTMMNTQSIERDTSDRQYEYQTGFMAKELAMKGRKLVISSWIKNNGTRAEDIGTLDEAGGTINLLPDTLRDLFGTEIAFTVRGVYDSTVHDVTSRFRWGSLLSSPLQMRVPDLNLTISSSTILDMDSIAIDTQSLDDLEQTIVTDLALVGSLGSLNLGVGEVSNEIQTELNTAYGSSDIEVLVIDQAMRDEFGNSQDGIHFPDQVIQMINDYANTHPGSETTLASAASLPGTFGSGAETILRVENDVSLTADLIGQGVLFIEGDFSVPSGVTFNWDGIVVVAPPSGDLSGFIDLSGNVHINGALVIAQDGVPNTGHMDLTVHTDLTSSWLYPWGSFGSVYQPWWKHTHDFSGLKGTQVGFTSSTAGFTVHSSETQFDTFLSNFSANDELVFEFLNFTNHGLASVTMDVTGIGITTSRVSAGFNDLLKSPLNAYKSNPIRVGDLQHLDISVNRLSSLKKLWDTGSDYPNCFNVNDKTEGPDCVGGTYSNRYTAFALRVYQWDGFNENHVYDASLYWHRNTDEEEEYEDEMEDLIDDINSLNYGMDITLGDSTIITVNQDAMDIIGGFTGTGSGSIINLGTWHRHWEPDDVNNPLKYIASP